jgi:hypothetical protein
MNTPGQRSKLNDVDIKCVELARHFFPKANEWKLKEIAIDIQEAVELYPDTEDGEEADANELPR